MGNIIVIKLSSEERAVLEKGWRRGKSLGFRQRCQIVLLKAEQLTSKEVAKQVGCCEVVVNNWLRRYQEEGIEGLKVRRGRGRRTILKAETDLAIVRQAVQEHRQKVSLAKVELTQELGKDFSDATLRRFLKKMVAASSELDAV